MKNRLHPIVRDMHLYLGLFIAPFLLAFAVSVFFLVHSWIPGSQASAGQERSVRNVVFPAGLESLEGRARVDALQRILPSIGVSGEIGFVRHLVKRRSLEFSVSAPGREIKVALDLAARTAAISRHESGLWDGLVMLHKSPGQHLVAIRVNWLPMLAWRWFADGTVYLLMLITISGLYLWALIRAERAIGLALLMAGTLSFAGLVYAVIH